MSWKNFLGSFARFPFEIFTGIAFSVYGIYINHTDGNLMLLVAFPFLYALFLMGSVFAERFQKTYSLWHILWIIFSLIIAGFSFFHFYTIPEHMFWIAEHAIWIISLLLLAIVFGFWNKNNEISLWNASEKVLFAILSAIFLGGVFFIGTMLFYAALDELFNIIIENEWYFDTWLAITGIISSIVFLTFFPTQEQTNAKQLSFSSFTKIFTFYILLPLSAGYIALMYGYTFKMIITQEIPNGFLAPFITGFSGVILFTIYQLIAFGASYSWTQRLSQIISFSLIPQACIMLWAIYIRIDWYAITEPRYYGIILGVWILFTAIFWSIRYKHALVSTFILLAVLFSVSTFGPWGAKNLSLSSQIKRAEEILIKYNLIENNTIQFPNIAPQYTSEDMRELSSIFEYIFTHATVESLQKKTLLNIPSEVKTKEYAWERASIYLDKLFIPANISVYIPEQNSLYINTRNDAKTSNSTTYSIKEHDFIILLEENGFREEENNETILFQNGELFLKIKDQTIPLTAYIIKESQNTNIAHPPFLFENEKIKIEMNIFYFDGTEKNNKIDSFYRISGIVLGKEK